MNDRGKRDIRDRRLLVRYLIFLVAVGVVGFVAIRVMIHRGRSEHLLEAARAAGYPTSYTELAEYTRLPEGVPNAADVYTRAFAAYVPLADDANLPLVGQAELPDRGKPMPEPMAKAVSDLLTANQECLALLREAAHIEHCRYDWDYADWEGRSPESEDLKPCIRLLELAAILQAQQGNPSAAFEHIRDGMRLGESLCREPGTIGHLLRIACDAAALAGLERALSVTSFSDSQLNQLRDVLNSIADRFDFSRVVITEQCFTVGSCGDLLDKGKSQGLGSVFRIWTDRTLIDVLTYGSHYIEAARLPPHERLDRIRAIDRDLEDLRLPWHTLAKIMVSEIGPVAELDLRMRAHLDLVQTGLAIERYRLVKGDVPTELAALVPQHLEAVPIDPFDGQPIRYRRTETGYRLYSIMEDGQDNGGLTRDEVNQGDPHDLCFIVAR